MEIFINYSVYAALGNPFGDIRLFPAGGVEAGH